jgi:hypothetical protein
MLAGSSTAAPPGSQIDLLNGFDPEDVGNAHRIRVLHDEGLRFCHAFKKWLIWDKRRWRVDETGAARLLAQQTMKEFARTRFNPTEPPTT